MTLREHATTAQLPAQILAALIRLHVDNARTLPARHVKLLLLTLIVSHAGHYDNHLLPVTENQNIYGILQSTNACTMMSHWTPRINIKIFYLITIV